MWFSFNHLCLESLLSEGFYTVLTLTFFICVTFGFYYDPGSVSYFSRHFDFEFYFCYFSMLVLVYASVLRIILIIPLYRIDVNVFPANVFYFAILIKHQYISLKNNIFHF